MPMRAARGLHLRLLLYAARSLTLRAALFSSWCAALKDYKSPANEFPPFVIAEIREPGIPRRAMLLPLRRRCLTAIDLRVG